MGHPELVRWSFLSGHNEGEGFVHGAGAVALRVESDVPEAEWAEGGGDSVKSVEREGAGEVGADDLYASKVAVVSDADLREAEAVESGFCAFDLRKIGGGDGAAVLDAGGEAGTGRLFCEGEASFAGEGADFGLGELRGDQGSEGVVHRSGLLAGAELAAVVEVHAVGNVGETGLLAAGFHAGEELVLAVETALGVVALVVGVVEFGGEEGFGGNVVLGGEGEGGGQLGAGEGR